MSAEFNFRLGQVKAGLARSCQAMSGRGQDTYGKVKFWSWLVSSGQDIN